MGDAFDFDAHCAALIAAASDEEDDEEDDEEEFSDYDEGGLDSGDTDQVLYDFEGDWSAPPVKIMQDLSALAAACSEHVPAWSWRTWPGSLIMSKWIELNWAERLRNGAVVIEIGAGTGLVSCVAGKLGARVVAATDLPQAMPLLKHNIWSNFGAPVEAADGIAPTFRVRCPAGHAVKQGMAEDEDSECRTLLHVGTARTRAAL
jgi:hypothetical protein